MGITINRPILFFDGECGLCHRFVSFVLDNEPEPFFQFAPLQGDTFKESFTKEEIDAFPDSLILKTTEGETLILSDAAVYAMKTLSPGWRRVGEFIGVFPMPLRDFGYRCVAAVRRKIFKKPDSACPLVAPELRQRFLM